MSIKRIATLLFAGALAISFVLSALAQTAAEKRAQVPATESSVCPENAQQQAQETPSSEHNANEEQATQPATETPDEEASEESAQQ
jgi:hypothetical protein